MTEYAKEYVGYLCPPEEDGSIYGAITQEPIVRCRDCEHFGMFQPNKRYKSAPSCCKFQITLPDSDGFCAWGERKDELL